MPKMRQMDIAVLAIKILLIIMAIPILAWLAFVLLFAWIYSKWVGAQEEDADGL